MEDGFAQNSVRKDAWRKVAGRAAFNDDAAPGGCLHARLLTGAHAHASILSVDVGEAAAFPGVRAVVTGRDCSILTGSVIRDMPVLAIDTVRYCGEPVAIVVADEEWQAAQAVRLIRIKYRPLPVVNSVTDAAKPGSALVHPCLGEYKHTVKNVYPESGTNVANRTRIRMGDMEEGWAKSAAVVEAEYRIPQASHAFMETRSARAEVLPCGRIVIHTSTQAPHAVRSLIAEYFNLIESDISIETPFVGGGYGGKVNPHPEMMAYIASLAAGGREVRLSLTREESFITGACKIGAVMHMRLGADGAGRLTALEAGFLIDSGAYADTAPVMSVAAAVSCGGAYHIPNIRCDSLCVYTNHIYATSFRGFGHEVPTFAMERTMEKLAERLGMDPAELRLINAMREGDLTPTQVRAAEGIYGNVEACIRRLMAMAGWDRGTREQLGPNLVRAKGMACFSKTSSSPTNASSAAFVTFCSDGSANLNCSVVECGPGMTTALPRILAARLGMDAARVHMNMAVGTQSNPEHWKTVASMSTYLAGNAILAAADDAIGQLKGNAAIFFHCTPEEIGIGGGMAFMLSDPSAGVEFKDIVHGVKGPDGSARGVPVVGSGTFMMQDLTVLDRETGKGRPGPYWTVGAQAVEVEYDSRDHTFRLVRAATAVDAGKVIDAACAAGQVMGGMNMGLSIATREVYRYSGAGTLKDANLRLYKIMHFGENPEYAVEFVETPNPGGPYGERGIGEHGVLGMPPALANALCRAAGVQLDSLPITYETLWETAGNPPPGGKHDRV